MRDLQLFPDHQIIQNILMEDINIPYDELKKKVITPIKPIYDAIDKLLRNRYPSFPALKISSSSKEHTQTRLRNTRAYWTYHNPRLGFKKNLWLFIQLGAHKNRKKTIFWGFEYFVGGASDEIDSVYHFFKRINNINVFKESGGVGGTSKSGTSVFGIVNQYTIDELPNLQRDIKEEIAEGIGKLFQEIEQRAEGTAPDRSSHLVLHLPTRTDVDTAQSQLRKSSDEVIDIKDVLDQIEVNFNETEKELKENWREITEQNIKTWFSKK